MIDFLKAHASIVEDYPYLSAFAGFLIICLLVGVVMPFCMTLLQTIASSSILVGLIIIAIIAYFVKECVDGL